MADDIDRANDLAAAEREASIRRTREAMRAAGSEECEACGEPISALRRAAMPSAIRCAPCQQMHERKRW